MLSLKEFSDNFNGRTLPNELLQVFEFQRGLGDDLFSEAFILSTDGKQGLYHGWSTNPEFLDNLFPFARANWSGSFYAFWGNSTTAKLSEMPIVIFGDEGGEHVVAENFIQFLKILTFDSEPMVDHKQVMYYKDQEDYQPSPKLELFKRWIKEAFSIDPIDSPDEIVNAAQKKYGAAFKDWKLKYLQC